MVVGYLENNLYINIDSDYCLSWVGASRGKEHTFIDLGGGLANEATAP